MGSANPRTSFSARCVSDAMKHCRFHSVHVLSNSTTGSTYVIHDHAWLPNVDHTTFDSGQRTVDNCEQSTFASISNSSTIGGVKGGYVEMLRHDQRPTIACRLTRSFQRGASTFSALVGLRHSHARRPKVVVALAWARQRAQTMRQRSARTTSIRKCGSAPQPASCWEK